MIQIGLRILKSKWENYVISDAEYLEILDKLMQQIMYMENDMIRRKVKNSADKIIERTENDLR